MLMNLRNALMAGKRLPYDAELEYLESTGTQYINTGVYANNETAVELLCKYTQSFQDNAVISMDAGSNTTRAFTIEIYNARIYFSFSDALTQNASLQSSWNQISASQNRLNVNGTSVSVSQAPAFQCEYPLFMFCYGRNGVPIIYGKWQIASCKIYQNCVLVRDFIPVRKGTVGYLYDRVSGKLFGNAGTGDFVLGPDVVPVEWLESGAYTYINTGIIPDDTYGMEVTGYTTQTNDSAWIGTRNSLAQRCFMGYSPSLGFYYGWNGRQDVQYTTGVWSTASMNLYNSRKNIMDGTEVGSIAETLGAQDRAIYLFGLTANGTLGLKLKSALITKGSDDVLKLVSVRVGNGSSWEGAMMDTLTRRIYRNAGTGAFGYGNDLKYPIPA